MYTEAVVIADVVAMGRVFLVLSGRSPYSSGSPCSLQLAQRSALSWVSSSSRLGLGPQLGRGVPNMNEPAPPPDVT